MAVAQLYSLGLQIMRECEQSDTQTYSQQTVVYAALGSFACFWTVSMLFLAVAGHFAFDALFQGVVSVLSSIFAAIYILHHRHFFAHMAKLRRSICLVLLSCGIVCGLFILIALVTLVGVGLLTFASKSSYYITQ